MAPKCDICGTTDNLVDAGEHAGRMCLLCWDEHLGNVYWCDECDKVGTEPDHTFGLLYDAWNEGMCTECYGSVYVGEHGDDVT